MIMIVLCIDPSWLYSSGAASPMVGNAVPGYANCHRMNTTSEKPMRRKPEAGERVLEPDHPMIGRKQEIAAQLL
jgi:hypothetical protein